MSETTRKNALAKAIETIRNPAPGVTLVSHGWVDRSETQAKERIAVAASDLLAALKALRIDANRLCDRQLGGSYEDDCRRSIAVADAAIRKAEGR